MNRIPSRIEGVLLVMAFRDDDVEVEKSQVQPVSLGSIWTKTIIAIAV